VRLSDTVIVKQGEEMSLTAQARKLHPNRRNGAKWVMAIRYLRRKNLWVLDKFSRKPSWSMPQ